MSVSVASRIVSLSAEEVATVLRAEAEAKRTEDGPDAARLPASVLFVVGVRADAGYLSVRARVLDERGAPYDLLMEGRYYSGPCLGLAWGDRSEVALWEGTPAGEPCPNCSGRRREYEHRADPPTCGCPCHFDEVP